MPFDCQHRRNAGPDACLTGCAATAAFSHVRVDRPDDLPPADRSVIDIAVLDMHHGWPNLGHHAIVHAMQNAVCDIGTELTRAGIGFRALSYDVRRGHAIPDPPGDRHALYVGTGGPGHLDPRQNDGVAPGSQGIAENPAWEGPLFRLFDRIAGSRDAVLFGVCHTFGVLCRWLDVADVVLRAPDKGGKSVGIVENRLTDEALRHPWFGRFADALPDRRRLRVLDNRLYDLVPRRDRLAATGALAVGTETLGVGGPAGEAMTMMEAARQADGAMPRIFAVNHHPEIVNRPRQLLVLEQMFERGDVTPEWYAERKATLSEPIENAWDDLLLHLTASYTLMAPLRHALYRLARERADAVGRRLDVDEASLPLTFDLESSGRTGALLP